MSSQLKHYSITENKHLFYWLEIMIGKDSILKSIINMIWNECSGKKITLKSHKIESHTIFQNSDLASNYTDKKQMLKSLLSDSTFHW